jgi:hypothetical protein
MAASTVTVTLGIQYTPPSAPANSGNVSYQVAASCQAQNVGQIDVGPTDAPATVFPIPFGSIEAAKVLIVKNRGSVDLGLRLNAALTDSFKIPPGGEFVFAAAAAPGTTPITSAAVAVITSPPASECCEYFAFGD